MAMDGRWRSKGYADAHEGVKEVERIHIEPFDEGGSLRGSLTTFLRKTACKTL